MHLISPISTVIHYYKKEDCKVDIYASRLLIKTIIKLYMLKNNQSLFTP